MSILKQDTTKKKWANKNNKVELGVSNNESKKYKIKAIQDSMVYAKKLVGHLSKLYYLVL